MDLRPTARSRHQAKPGVPSCSWVKRDPAASPIKSSRGRIYYETAVSFPGLWDINKSGGACGEDNERGGRERERGRFSPVVRFVCRFSTAAQRAWLRRLKKKPTKERAASARKEAPGGRSGIVGVGVGVHIVSRKCKKKAACPASCQRPSGARVLTSRMCVRQIGQRRGSRRPAHVPHIAMWPHGCRHVVIGRSRQTQHSPPGAASNVASAVGALRRAAAALPSAPSPLPSSSSSSRWSPPPSPHPSTSDAGRPRADGVWLSS